MVEYRGYMWNKSNHADQWPKEICVRSLDSPAIIFKASVIFAIDTDIFTLISYQRIRETLLEKFHGQYTRYDKHTAMLCVALMRLYKPIIAQIAQLSFSTSIPHRPGRARCGLQWSLSGQLQVCISYSQEDIKTTTEENLK